MKKIKICYIIILVGALLQNSCSSYIVTSNMNQRPSLPSPNVVWSSINYDSPPLKYYHGESIPGKTIDCKINYLLDNDLYKFCVISNNDTVFFSFSKYYIGTNVDSINVMMDMSTNDSQINVINDCSWCLHGRWFCRGSRPMSELCHISSTTPVHVTVFVLVDVMKDNEQQSIYETLKQNSLMRDMNRLDSIIQSLPDQ